jgi:hypothetical protein
MIVSLNGRERLFAAIEGELMVIKSVEADEERSIFLCLQHAVVQFKYFVELRDFQ